MKCRIASNACIRNDSFNMKYSNACAGLIFIYYRVAVLKRSDNVQVSQIAISQVKYLVILKCRELL